MTKQQTIKKEIHYLAETQADADQLAVEIRERSGCTVTMPVAKWFVLRWDARNRKLVAELVTR